jgi:nitrite reductase (NADH) large subunit
LCVRAPLPGKDLEGVIAYRDIADTNAMIDAAADHHGVFCTLGGVNHSH